MTEPEPLTAAIARHERSANGDASYCRRCMLREPCPDKEALAAAHATIDAERQQRERAEAQVEEMRREACAAIDTLENIFNGLTSPEALNSGISGKLAQEMAGDVADTLATAERCQHQAQVERLRELVRRAETIIGIELEPAPAHTQPNGALQGAALEISDWLASARAALAAREEEKP